VPAAIACVRLNHHGVELSPNDGAGGAHLKARGVRTVLTDVAHEKPAAVLPGCGELFDEFDVAPVDAIELAGVVVAVAAQRMHAAVGARELIPFLAGDFAGFAANADRGVGVKPHWLSHVSPQSLRLSHAC